MSIIALLIAAPSWLPAISGNYGHPGSFDYEADLDGASNSNYPAHPRFLDIRSSGISTVYVQAQWGDYAINMTGSSTSTNRATTLIGLTFAGSLAAHWFADKVSDLGTLAVKVINEEGGPYDMPIGIW